MMNNNTTTGPTADESMLDKITKLLAKAEGTSNPHEAEAFTAKAIALMSKWAIDEAMLQSHKGQTVDDITQVFIPIRGSYHQAHTTLAHLVGKGFGFRTVKSCVKMDSSGKYDKTIKAQIVWIGFRSELESAQMLYTSLLLQLDTATKAYVKDNDTLFKCFSGMEKFKARRSFIYGFADEVHTRLVESRKTAKDSTPGAALVFVGRDGKVNDWMAEHYPDLVPGRRSNVQITHGGYTAGKSAGAKAGLASKSVPGSRKALNQ